MGSGRGAAAGPPGRAGGGRAGGASPQTQSEPARAAPSPGPRGEARRGGGSGERGAGARPPPPRAARLQQRGLLRAAAPRSRLPVPPGLWVPFPEQKLSERALCVALGCYRICSLCTFAITAFVYSALGTPYIFMRSVIHTSLL